MGIISSLANLRASSWRDFCVSESWNESPAAAAAAADADEDADDSERAAVVALTMRDVEERSIFPSSLRLVVVVGGSFSLSLGLSRGRAELCGRGEALVLGSSRGAKSVGVGA